MRIIFTVLFSFLCVTALGDDPILSVRSVSAPEVVRAGETAEFTVELDIHAPYHVNSSQPLEDYLIPTSLEIGPISGLVIEEIQYPMAVIKRFSFSDTPMAVYEGVVTISIAATPDSELIGTEVALEGTIRYQACTDTLCLPEDSLPFSILFPVSTESSAPMNPSAVASGNKAAAETQINARLEPSRESDEGAEGSLLPDFNESSLPVMLILVLLGGLALNLTPCVYPMIPITISYFGGQAGGRKGSLIAHACLYVIGMAVTYSLLGVVAALTGGLLGAALQHPPVLIAIALVMVLLALSMFEVYELRMPGFMNRMAGGNRKGFFGTILMGMTVGIVAAPCIGPFVLGLLTYVGNRGNAFIGFLLFFVLSIGMGLPLLILGIFSGSIHRLPRSGEWMIWVRKVFGFILLAMALFFLKTLLDHPLAYPLSLSMLLVLAGAYLAWITPVSGAGKGFAWLRNIVGIGFFIAALIIAISGMDAYLKVSSLEADNGSVQDLTMRSGDIEWLTFSDETLQRASLEAKPVLIDFYADWCAPCKEYDKHTFSNSEVVNLSGRFLMVKVDFTEAGSPGEEALRKRLRVQGFPTLVFLMPDGTEMEDLRTVGFEEAAVFKPKMEEAYRRTQETGLRLPEDGGGELLPAS